MLILNGRLVYNRTGDTLGHYPFPRQSADGTAVIEDLFKSTDSSDREIQASTTATLDTASTTTDAAAGPDQANIRRVPVSSTSGFVVGRRYWIESADGHGEPFEVAGIATGDYLEAESPLAGTYASGSDVLGLLMSFSLADVVVTDDARMERDEPFRVVWTYADGSKFQQNLELLRHDFGDLDVQRVLDEVEGIFPDVRVRVGHHGKDTLLRHVRSARDQLRTILVKRGDRPEKILLGDQGVWILVWHTLLHIAHLGNWPMGDDPGPWISYCLDNRNMYLDDVLVGRAGAETVELDEATDTATGREAIKSRRTIEIT